MITKRLSDRLAEADADVLDGMVGIDRQIAVNGDDEVKQTMPAEEGQEVVESADAGVNAACPRAVNREVELDLRFGGLPANRCAALRHERR